MTYDEDRYFGCLLRGDLRGAMAYLAQFPECKALYRRLHFLGGKTGGYYGPYVWRTTETAAYRVELPEETRTFTVRLLDGFVTKGWIDYLSFGKLGTGGWTDGDGVLCCVRSSYDLNSEAFQVSLLKHEAQHALDLERWSSMSSAVLEYRAKLVELIYSAERNLLPQFAQEADGSVGAGGHALAAHMLIEGFARKFNSDAGTLKELPIGLIQKTARELFRKSERRLEF